MSCSRPPPKHQRNGEDLDGIIIIISKSTCRAREVRLAEYSTTSSTNNLGLGEIGLASVLLEGKVQSKGSKSRCCLLAFG